MISSLTPQSESSAVAVTLGLATNSLSSNVVSTKQVQKAFSCGSSGYSSQSLSECDLNSNKNKPIDTLSSTHSTPASSQSGSSHQIDKINPSSLLLESTNSLSCIRTSTPTNPINSTTLDNQNVYKSLSSDCCYSDTLSSNYSSHPSGLVIPIQQSNLISPTSQCSLDYYRQISFNPTCNSSSLCQSKNYYYVNNMKFYGDNKFIEQQAPYSLISPITNLFNTNGNNKNKSNPGSFISTSTKNSIPVIKQEKINHHLISRPHINSQPDVQHQSPPKLVQSKLKEETKTSRLTLVITFLIKLLNCFNVFSLFKSNKSKSSNTHLSSELSNQQSIENVYTSSTSLPLSSESTSSIPKILLKNKKNSTRSNDMACKLYAQSVLSEPEKKQQQQLSGIESPSSFNFVGFANNCVSSTPIVQQQKPKQNIVKSKEPVVKIKKNKMNIAAIESQLTSSYYVNYNTKNTNKTNTNIPIQIEKETYDNLPELDHKQMSRTLSCQVPAFPINLVTNNSDEVEHYVKINTMSLDMKSSNTNNTDETSAVNTTNYDNELENMPIHDMYSSSSPSSGLSSSSSLVNSVNIYLNNLNKSGQNSNSSSSSACVSNSSSFNKQQQQLNQSNRKLVQFNQLSDFIVDSTKNELNRNNYLVLNKQTSIRNGQRGNVNTAPFYEDYLCDKEVESYFDNPNYYDCYKQKLQQQQAKMKQFNTNGVLLTQHQSFMMNNQTKNLVATKTRNCSLMINSSNCANIGSGFSVFKTHINSNLSGMIRQSNHGESYC